MIVSDSSPLIFLAKLDLFDNLKKIHSLILVPKEVYDEVVGKTEKSLFKEILVLEKLFDEGFIKIIDVKIKKTIKSLHLGECAAIQLCMNKKIKQMLVDDGEAIAYCKLFGIEPIRTTRLLLEFLKRDLLNYEEFKSNLIKLSEEGYFLTIEVYDYLLEQAKKLKK